MSNLTEQISYLKGLAEGMKLDPEKDETKLITKMLDFLSDMAEEFEEIRSDHEDLSEFVESIDADLSELEDSVYEDEDEDFDEDDDEDEEDEEDEENEEEDEDDNLVEYTCPHCGEEMTFEVDSFDFDEDYLFPT